ncbi:hypothetical protein K440DRAFT_659314 [Wilcoxina mikolae CBS 423.85]|nr:hypothetical protein K440DRAFT_659314 [Wilcoxina mikolae CBS 423.85]
MKFLHFTALTAAAMASVVFAQSSGSATSSAPAATHTVKVGWPIGQHAFSPQETKANLGDKIIFDMYPANHSVVRMDPSSPCVPYDMAGHASNEAWWSGFYPVSDPKNPQPYDIVVDTTDPIWFYCSAPGSCKTYGMVGVINLDASKNNLSSIVAQAKSVNYSLSPGEKIPSDSTASAAATTATASTTSNNNNSSSGLGGGAIAGIAIGAIGAFALVGLLFFLVGRKKKAEELKEKERLAADAEAAAKNNHEQQPPMYQDPAVDPRYSMAVGSPPPNNRDTYYAGKQGHESLMADHTGQQSLIADHTGHTTHSMMEERNPHRLSELPSQNYDPVEIYTPGLPEHMEFPNSPAHEEPPRRDA